MIIGGDNVLQLCELYRCTWISGRPGGYKTSLAFALAETWLKRGYRLVTNTMTPWADDLKNLDLLDDGKLHAVVILDEAGLELKWRAQVEQILAYSRKMDIILLMPSFHPPVRSSQIVNIQALFNFKQIGMPLIVYKWRVKLGMFSDSGLLMWWNPSYIYGVYSTLSPGDYIDSVYRFLVEKKDKYKKRYGYERHDGISELEQETESGEARLAEALDELGADLQDFVSIQGRKRRRR